MSDSNNIPQQNLDDADEDEVSARTSYLKRHISQCSNIDVSSPPPKRIPLDPTMYREKLAVAIIQHNYPLTYVEDEATRELHKFLHPDAIPVTSDMARDDVLKIFEREKMILKENLEKINGRICLAFDTWAESNMCGSCEYIILTVHYVDEQWVLRKRVLNFKVGSCLHNNGPITSQRIINLLRDWGIEKKIFTFTLVNEPWNYGLVKSLRKHLRLNDVLLCDKDFLHVHSGAHVFVEIVQLALRGIDGTIRKIRECVKYFRGSATRKLKFVECIAKLSLQCGRYVLEDDIWRWETTYLMLDSAVAYHGAYVQLQLVDSNFKTCPSQKEWTMVERITRVLKPIHDIMTLFSRCSYPTSNLYFYSVWKIQFLIQEEIQNSDPLISKIAKDMKEKFDKYWNASSTVLSFAIVLDPRYKLKMVEYCFSKLDMEDDLRWEKVKSVVDGLYKLYGKYKIRSEMINDKSIQGSSNVDVGNTIDELDDFDSFQSQFGGDKSQLDEYLKEPAIDRKQNLNVLQFWMDNKWRYPELALMARDILSIPITTDDSHRSLARYRRSSSLLSNALVCTRDWLFGEDEIDKGLVEDIELLIPFLRS